MEFGLLELKLPSGWKFRSPEAGPLEGAGPNGETMLVSHSSANEAATTSELAAHFESMREQSVHLLSAAAAERGTVAKEPVVLRESPAPFVIAAASALQRSGQKGYFLQYMLLSLRSQHYFNVAGLGLPLEAMARWDPVFLGAKITSK